MFPFDPCGVQIITHRNSVKAELRPSLALKAFFFTCMTIIVPFFCITFICNRYLVPDEIEILIHCTFTLELGFYLKKKPFFALASAKCNQFVLDLSI